MTMNRKDDLVTRTMWVPAVAIVGLLVMNLIRGDAFSPRGAGGAPAPDRSAAAVIGGDQDRKKSPSETVPAPPSAAAQVQGQVTPAQTAKDEVRLGGVIASSADAAEAQKKVEKVRAQLKSSPNDYRLHYELGNALYDAGDQVGAISAYRRCLEINPKFVKAYVNLGGALRDHGDFKEAREALEKAVSIDDKDDVAHAALGFAYYTDKRYPDAMHEFKRALAINPRSVHATYYMGMAFADAQIYREAIKWWDKVCEIDPNSDACFGARENNTLLRRIVR